MKDPLDLIHNEDGQGLVEYALIISLVILVVVGSLSLFGEDLALYYQNNIVEKLP